ncbi:MAG: lipopolysaccharide kinase InaA family protein [Planctomycetota bacterium]
MREQLTWVEPEMEQVLKAAGLRQYGDYVACKLGKVVGQSGTTLTKRIRLATSSGHGVYFLKVYRYSGRGWRHRSAVGPWRRHDKGFTEARNYRILREHCGLLVPDVVCHGCRRRWYGVVDAFILTRGVPGAIPLDELAANRWPDAHKAFEDPARRHLLRSTARIVSRMHAAGFYHVDLQWRNLLVANDERPHPAVYVIDSTRGGLRRCGIYRAHGQLRDLSSLCKQARVSMTRTEQLRWLRDYLGAEASRRNDMTECAAWPAARLAVWRIDRLRYSCATPEKPVTKCSSTVRAMIRTILLDRSIKDNDVSA